MKRQKSLLETFRTSKGGDRMSRVHLIHERSFRERSFFVMPPLPQSVAVREKKLLFVAAVIEVFIAVVVVMQDASPHPSEISASIHFDGGVQTIDRFPNQGLVRTAGREIAKTCILHLDFWTRFAFRHTPGCDW